MLKFELTNKSIKGKKVIENLVPWQDGNIGHKLNKEETEIIKIFKHDRLGNKNIKITCDSNNYLKIPNFCKTYYSFISDDNYLNEELIVTANELNEVYIPISDHEISFNKSSSLFRPYVIDEINSSGTVITRYSIYVYIKYKDNGKIANEKFDFAFEVRINKVFSINITYGLPEYIFLGYLIWGIINLALGKNIVTLINNPTTIVVIVSCFIFSIVKALFLEHSIINQLLYAFKFKRRFYYTNRELKAQIKKYKNLQKNIEK